MEGTKVGSTAVIAHGEFAIDDDRVSAEAFSWTGDRVQTTQVVVAVSRVDGNAALALVEPYASAVELHFVQPAGAKAEDFIDATAHHFRCAECHRDAFRLRTRR